LLIEQLSELILEISIITKVTLFLITAFEYDGSSITVFDFNEKMIISYKNEIRSIINTSNANKFRLNHTEWISYQRFGTVGVQMLCLTDSLKFITENQNLVLNRTIESTENITNVVFI
jgi:hypothetical protein